MGLSQMLIGFSIFAASLSVIVINLYTPQEIYSSMVYTFPSLKSYKFLHDVLVGPGQKAKKSKEEPSLKQPAPDVTTEIIFTKEELAKYKGGPESKGLYLAMLGQVFDVSKGKQHYGPGGGYSFFAGIDGTRAFVSGDFTEKGLIEDINGLSHQDLLGIEDWMSFYRKDYKYVGKVIGQYYDKEGSPTPALEEAQKLFSAAHKWKSAQEDERKLYPPCNSHWSQADGGYVWCSTKSGGIDRGWAGVPRQLFTPGKKDPRCACIRTSGPPSDNPAAKTNRGDLDNPNLKQYANCKPNSERCDLPK